MPSPQLTLAVLPEMLAICRLNADDCLPDWALKNRFFSITRTADELSIVCPQSSAPADVKGESDWRGLMIEGPLEFSLIGILASLSALLAEAGISIFVISTFDTDYLLVKADKLEQAIRVLSAAGHKITI